MSSKLSVWYLGIIGGSLIICGLLTLLPSPLISASAGGLLPFLKALLTDKDLLVFGSPGVAIIILSVLFIVEKGKLNPKLISLYSVAGVFSLASFLLIGLISLVVVGMELGRIPFEVIIPIFIGLVGSLLALSGPLLLHLKGGSPPLQGVK